jgi:hypothetical protein
MDGFEVISCYSRAQAIADGVLVDVSELAREVGYRWPVALTDHLWHDYVVPPLDLVSEGQSISGRLCDVLNVLKYTIGQSKDESRLNFSVLFAMEPGKAPIPVELVSVAGPGDDGRPTITVMLPEDD